jgi:O-6-methylguanine DNA methyltransferase
MTRWTQASEFDRLVYRAICGIRPGETRSYQWVAERIGHPRAARAVGNALRRNPFAPRVPCHRVIRADGRLGGYAKGRARKAALLAQERRRQRHRPARVAPRHALAGPALAAG